MSSLSSTEKITRLRALMAKPENNVQAYIVYSEDAHQSEYTPDCDKRRSFISGFTGSAGTAVITNKEAALWTDGRYYLQAENELDGQHWKLMKFGLPETPTIPQWLNKVLDAKSRVGIDPKLVSKANTSSLEKELQANGNELAPIFTNLIDQVWEDRPSPPLDKVFIHPLKFAGVFHEEKINKLRDELQKEKVDAFVVTSLDEIAWLFNLRGSDVTFNPVFISYALVSTSEVVLYIDEVKIPEEVKQHLGKVVIRPYTAIFDDLKTYNSQKKRVWLDGNRSCIALFNSLDASQILEKPSPITLPKALKNPEELDGLRQCHIRDAAALISYFAWLEERLNAGDSSLTEANVADKVDWFRSQQSGFVSLSFDTISSSGPNGAIIHYKPSSQNCAKVVKDQLYLCDSGGQYRDGTTDVTRTIHFGEPTAHQKRCFTKVLQGHIAIDSAVFPEGTTGGHLDLLARAPLWRSGLDFRHGTGHGVGAFLNVHEGPQGISFREGSFKVPMQATMTITNEPGYYEDGSFGIRIENVLITKEVKTEFNFGGKKYLGFEHITLVPIQTKMMDTSIMSEDEIQWVNAYHKECFDKVSPLLSGAALEYLKRETQPIKK